MTQSMTYATLPTRERFDDAFDAECPNGYRISLGSSDSRACDGFRLGDGTWTADQLWDAINEIISFGGDDITVSEVESDGDDDECFQENTYYVIYADSTCGNPEFLEIGPDAAELIEWAQKFSDSVVESESRAVSCLNFAAAYGETGKCFNRHDAALDLVAGIMGTLGFEWI